MSGTERDGEFIPYFEGYVPPSTPMMGQEAELPGPIVASYTVVAPPVYSAPTGALSQPQSETSSKNVARSYCNHARERTLIVGTVEHCSLSGVDVQE
eukprot:6284915-Amphidinium_carterae.2